MQTNFHNVNMRRQGFSWPIVVNIAKTKKDTFFDHLQLKMSANKQYYLDFILNMFIQNSKLKNMRGCWLGPHENFGLLFTFSFIKCLLRIIVKIL
jgi:hypothetical protein